MQKSTAIHNNSVTLSSVIMAIIVCKSLYFDTIKLQQFSLITKFSDSYISSNLRYLFCKCYEEKNDGISHRPNNDGHDSSDGV